MQKLAVAIAVLLTLGLGARSAWADDPAARFSLERGAQPHAGMPFKLILGVSGFDQDPPPEQPKLAIAGATVTPLGATPNVSRSIQIVNGRRSDSVQVTWVLAYRVEATSAGRLVIPATTVAQGGKQATAAGATIDLDTVALTDDMKLELQLPQRPVFVGEAVEAHLVWQFRRQPEDQTFALPMAQAPELTVTAPPVTDQRHMIEVASTAKTLQLPYTIDEIETGGQKWERVTIRMFVAPRVVGKVAIPPSSVSAGLAVGQRDFFGNADTKQFRAVDIARTLDARPLPETDKPPGFAGAVGTNFAIGVATAHSVVQVGEPLELTITVKGGERLDALALPKLDGPGMLPADKFSAPGDPPIGELSDDGKTKTFKVTAQLTAATTEIPALALAYFDPVKGAYQVAYSDPIALSVAGSAVVGANDVVSAAPQKPAASGSVTTGELTLVGADLALSSLASAEAWPFGGPLVIVLVALLYAVPLLLLAGLTWRIRTRASREEAADVRAARKQLETALALAATKPARESAGPLGQAIRGFARAIGVEPDRELLARLETESFAPTAAGSALPAELRARVQELAQQTARPVRRPATATALVVFLGLGLGLAAAAPARADAPSPAPAASLDDGRAAYEHAMAVTDATARRAAFKRAETLLAGAAAHAPDRPELLADWGNAALGAGDVGAATLAYRRALAIDPASNRAQKNLAWLRERAPEALRPAHTAGAADALLFFHDWPGARLWLVGAAAFATAVLLLVPWRGRRRRGLAMLAILPAIVWLAMTFSALTADRHAGDAVIVDTAVLRAADSAGAPAALVQPLPPGTEVTALEHRSPWTKVRIANGTVGWVADGAIIPVAP